MPEHYRRTYCLFALAIFFSACTSLKPVNDFAAASLLGAQKFESLPVSYQSLCLDNCREQDIKNGKLNPSNCDCKAARLADSVDGLFYKTLAAYLDGLARLSAGGTTDYKFDGVSDQLTGLGVSAADAGAYAKLGGVLTKAITDGYRKGKTRAYIREANGPLQTIIAHLKANIGTSLAIDLNAATGKLESDYFDLVRNSKGNAYEQRKIIEEFYAIKADRDSQLKALKAYAALLQTIADGHQQLAENPGDLKAMLIQYASNIKDIRTQIQILNKK